MHNFNFFIDLNSTHRDVSIGICLDQIRVRSQDHIRVFKLIFTYKSYHCLLNLLLPIKVIFILLQIKNHQPEMYSPPPQLNSNSTIDGFVLDPCKSGRYENDKR